METSRRQALAGAAALALAGALPRSLSALKPEKARPRIVRPGRLRPGDTVGLVDPASALWEPMNVEIVAESLAVLGFKTKRGANLLARRGYFAGTDEQRAADLNAMFADPEVRAIHCVRGGWGCARLLPLLDWQTIARNPKILLGYSDITALLLSLHAKTGLVTFHGPVAASRWNPFNVGFMKRVLQDGEAVAFENLKEIDKDDLTVIENRTQTLHPGTARGRLLGGNLTVLTSLVGSGYLPDWDGCILFIEDVEEAPYRIDRMLTQLRLAGILQQARAVIWGNCTRCNPGEGFGSLTVLDVLNDHLLPLGVPAWAGAMIGHVDRQFTLPVGIEVEVDATAGTLRMLEPAVLSSPS
ncbi:MAG: muramoyltetrapeptide carboxypeptidase [Acidobacteriota bacterium]|jgi:muramoyltetrapeptide carboxypeptidase|nr:muramoyltetrapeptide carboxypeptidase [Acidobacteriota bacterium]